MHVLIKRLLRAIWSSKGQFLAMVAIVAIGISLYISITTAYFNLTNSQQTFYRENNFADHFFHVVRAPEEIMRQIAAVPGVAQATGRIQKDVPVFKDNNERASARLTSYPLPMDKEVNQLHLLSGRLFEEYSAGSGIEVLVDPQYALANGISEGDPVVIGAEGKKVTLRMTGTGISPEFIYAMKDLSSFAPEPKSFGIIMISQYQAQQILHMTGQINQALVTFMPGVNEKEAVQKIKDILEPYGNLSDYPRKDQLSHALLQGELDGLRATSFFMPVLFLGIAAAIQFVLLGRMIKNQRLQIGIMKALGYSSSRIIMYYTGYALMITMLGALLGIILGVNFATYFSSMYAMFFNLPQAIGSVNIQAAINSILLSIMVGAGAGLSASRQVLKIHPAESMRPEPPKKSGAILLERLPILWNRLNASWRMSLRTVARNKVRFALVVIGMIGAVSMLLLSLFFNDAVDYMADIHYYKQTRHDILVRFQGPVKDYELLNLARLEGVHQAEAMLEIPVKIHFKDRTEDDLIKGLSPETRLKAIYDAAGKEIALTEEGIVISSLSAKKLGAKVGDEVMLESLLGLGPSYTTKVKITGINTLLIGGASYSSLSQANKLIHESQLISGAMLKVDPGQQAAIEEKLNEMTGITAISSRQKELDNFNKLMESMVYLMGIMILFALILGFVIVYNASVMSFNERLREMASLRVIGFTTQEISGLLFKETALQALLGIALGLPLGKLMINSFIAKMSTDLYSMPVIIYPSSFFYTALGGVGFVFIGHFFAVRGVKDLNLVEVLKSRE